MLVPSGETLVETRSCRACGVEFPITDADLAALGKLAPVIAGKKESIPAPSLCPGCRRVRRLSFRNVNKLYRGTCAKTGKSIVSIYAPGTPYVVYDYDSWWGDGWNPLDYGQDVDFSRPFLEQIDEVRRRTPRMALLN